MAYLVNASRFKKLPICCVQFVVKQDGIRVDAVRFAAFATHRQVGKIKSVISDVIRRCSLHDNINPRQSDSENGRKAQDHADGLCKFAEI